MSRVFSVATMFRTTPRHLMRRFFERMEAPLEQVNWNNRARRSVAPFLEALTRLPSDKRGQVEVELASIFELASEQGSLALRDAAWHLGERDYLVSLDVERSVWARAIRAWLEHRAVFDLATTAVEVELLKRGKRRVGLPLLTPRITKQSIKELEIALADCLRREEGRGGRCSVNHVRRRDDADAFIAYPDDFTQSILRHDEQGELIPLRLHPTFEMAFVYHAEKGTLETFGKVKASTKNALEAVFGRIILGAELAADGVRELFDLNRLRDPEFQLITDPRDGIEASLQSLRIDLPARGSLEFKPKTSGSAEDVRDVLNYCLNRDAVALEESTVTQAAIQMRLADRSRKARTITCQLSREHGVSIRTLRPDLTDLAFKYLRQWGFARA